MKTNYSFVQIRLDAEKKREWKAICAENGITITSMIKNAVEKYLEDIEDQEPVKENG